MRTCGVSVGAALRRLEVARGTSAVVSATSVFAAVPAAAVGTDAAVLRPQIQLSATSAWKPEPEMAVYSSVWRMR